jgi:hypothetical protein
MVLAIVSVAIGYGLTRTWGGWCFASILSFVGLYFLISVFMNAMVNMTTKAMSRLGEEQAIDEREVMALRLLDVDVAKSRALSLLEKQDKFVCETFDGTLRNDMQLHLPPCVRELFSQYRIVHLPQADSAIGHEFYGKSKSFPDMTRIGISVETAELVFRQGDETIFLVDGFEKSVDDEADRFRSIYHWLLIEH